MDQKDLVELLLKTYLPTTFVEMILCLGIILMLSYFGKVSLVISAIIAIIATYCLNTIYLFLKYRCKKSKKHNTVLVLINADDMKAFVNIKSKLEYAIKKIILENEIEQSIEIKFLKEYSWNKDTCEEIQKNHNILNYRYYQILNIVETTNSGKNCFSVTSNLKMMPDFIEKKFGKKNVKTLTEMVIKFSNILINFTELMEEENMFEDTKDLSSNILLSACSIIGTTISSMNDKNIEGLEKSKEIFEIASRHCKENQFQSKKMKKIYKHLEMKYKLLKCAVISQEISIYLDFKAINKNLKRKHSNNIMDVLECEKIDEYFIELSKYRKKFFEYYIDRLLYEILKGSNYIVLNNIVKDADDIMKSNNAYYMDIDIFEFMIEKAFIELFYGNYDKSIALYKGAYIYFKKSNISKDLLKELEGKIYGFCDLIYEITGNSACEFTKRFIYCCSNEENALEACYDEIIERQKYIECLPEGELKY